MIVSVYLLCSTQHFMKYLANTKKENVYSEFISTPCVLGQYPKLRQI